MYLIDEGTETAPTDELLTTIQQSLPSDSLMYLIAETFKVLSDPTRLRIVMALQQRELCVNDLATATDLTQSSVSYHLKTLRQLNLVRHRRQGKSTYYSLVDDHVSALLEIAQEHSSELI